MYLLDWEPLLIQTVPGVQLGVTVDGAKYLLEVVEDEDATVVVVGLLEELWSHNVDVLKVCLLLHLHAKVLIYPNPRIY